MPNITRRTFVRRSAQCAALPILGAGLAMAPRAQALGANQDIRLAVVGVGSSVKIGGMGKHEIAAFRRLPGVRVVALCDVDRAHLDPVVEQCRKRSEPVEAYTDVRKLLENKDIDAVVVTTPNHWHALVTIWACQAGKDVFVQKPASHNIYEGRKMIEAARKYGRVVHSPTMSRSPNGIFESMEYVRQGNLGKLRYVHGVNYKPRTSIGKVAGPQSIPPSLDSDLWCGPAPVLPVLREYLHYDWHWIWPYGNGDLGNMGIHSMDGCRMAVGQDTLPRRVMSLGGRFGYDDNGQTPNSQLMLLDYEPAPIIFEVRGLPKDKSHLAGAWDGNPAATMDSLRGIRVGMVVHCEGGYVVNHQAFDREGKLIQNFEPSVPNPEAGFLEAVRNRQTVDSVCDISQGHLSAALVHLCNASYRLGKKAGDAEIRERIDGRQEFAAVYERFQEHLSGNGVDLADASAVMGPMLTLDPASEQCTGEFAKEGNALITRHYRVPFVVPEEV